MTGDGIPDLPPAAIPPDAGPAPLPGSLAALRHVFGEPPCVHGPVYIWHWNGAMEEAELERQLRSMHANGVGGVMIWAYYGLQIPYLSDLWMQRVRRAVEVAAALGMRVWIWDEGSYPSGCGGGLVTRFRPNLQSKALCPVERVPVGGRCRVVQAMPPNLVAVAAARRGQGSDAGTLVALELRDLTPQVADGWLTWEAPDGAWELLIFAWEIRGNPFRNAHTGYKKDCSTLLPDYLKREATDRFIATTYEAYRDFIGHEFGKTVAGFFNDEPSVPSRVWTDDLAEVFLARKGYDLRPQLAALFFERLPLDVQGIRHDYFDVWSALFRERYAQPLAEWCERHGLLFTAHVCGEEEPATLTELCGDYFRFMDPVQVPGVDTIWRQVWPGRDDDFPKLASSAAHTRGRSLAMTETNAVYGLGLSVEQAKWVADRQFTDGINCFFVMEYLYSDESFRKFWHPADFSERNLQWLAIGDYNRYVRRLASVLSGGRPTARIGVYFPTAALWHREAQLGPTLKAVAAALRRQQRDYDYIDDEALLRQSEVRDGRLVTAGGASYDCLIVPTCRVLSAATVARLAGVAEAGGRVIIMGTGPWRGGGFQDPSPEGEMGHLLGQASVFLIPGLAEDVDLPVEALPQPDLRLMPACAAVRYVHRRFDDGEVYFLHNQGEAPWDGCAWCEGDGTPEVWDPLSGRRAAWQGVEQGEQGDRGLSLPLRLEGWETRLIVIGRAPGQDVAAPGEARPKGRRLRPVLLEGTWLVSRLDTGAMASTSLKPWDALGWPDYAGRVSYRLSFRLPPAYAERPLVLDLGEVRYSAEVVVNGKVCGRLSWRPYRVAITDAVRPGDNELEVTVTNTDANAYMGNAERFEALRASGLLDGSYFPQYEKFDREQLPSGLLGPVRILAP